MTIAYICTLEGFEAAERRAAQERRLHDNAATTQPPQSTQEAFKDVKEKLSASAKLDQQAMGETLFESVWHSSAMNISLFHPISVFIGQWSHQVSTEASCQRPLTLCEISRAWPCGWLPERKKYGSYLGCLGTLHDDGNQKLGTCSNHSTIFDTDAMMLWLLSRTVREI